MAQAITLTNADLMLTDTLEIIINEIGIKI